MKMSSDGRLVIAGAMGVQRSVRGQTNVTAQKVAGGQARGVQNGRVQEEVESHDRSPRERCWDTEHQASVTGGVNTEGIRVTRGRRAPWGKLEGTSANSQPPFSCPSVPPVSQMLGIGNRLSQGPAPAGFQGHFGFCRGEPEGL